MPNIPVRGLGETGVISDLSPQDIPLTAWSDARNIRFADGKISRYSVFKTFNEGYTYAKQPVGIFDGGGTLDEGYIVTVFNDGTMEQRYNGVSTAVTPVGTLGTSVEQITTCNLGGIVYVNREVDFPSYREVPTDGVFTILPGWAVGDRCKSMRAYKDFLIAINVLKSGTQYTGMVKWSNAAQAGAPPADWDTVAPASLAGETIINDIRGQLMDGLALGDSFMLYGEHQVFRMDYIGTPFIFRFSKVFDDQGIIAQNCAVDVDSRHYVFGRNDIYMHDGTQKISISDAKVKKTIFNELDFDKKQRCFVYHDRTNSEIGFCYPSTNDDNKWPLASTPGCNRAAVFNYRYQTWTFVDLPGLISSVETSQSVGITWADITAGWGTQISSWGANDGRKPRALLTCSAGNTTTAKAAQSYFLDNLIKGRVSNALDPDVSWDGYAIANYKDVDEMGAELVGRKLIRRIVPQIAVGNPENFVYIRWGQTPNMTSGISWGNTKQFYPWTDYKYDTRINGRYLSFDITIPAGTYAEFSGYDADLIQISGR